MKSYKEIIAANNNEPIEFTIELDDGNSMSASCWTDDEEVLNWPAAFTVRTSWRGDIGPFDNLHGELDGALDKFREMIIAKVGGNWCYHGADCEFEQVED